MQICVFCGQEMCPMGVMKYPIENRRPHMQFRYDFYCSNRACGAMFTYSLMDDNEAMDRHWYDPGTHTYEDETEEAASGN